MLVEGPSQAEAWVGAALQRVGVVILILATLHGHSRAPTQSS
jgi:hypothetical protein